MNRLYPVFLMFLSLTFMLLSCAKEEPSSDNTKTRNDSMKTLDDSTKLLDLGAGSVLKLIRVKAGSFRMGSPEEELGRSVGEHQRWVTLTKDYWLGETEVTQGQWKAVMENNPAEFKKGDNYPVESVSWYDAIEFCHRLNEKFNGKLPSGYQFSLPTEAQWEYACRAGTTTSLNSGQNITSEIIGCSNLEEVGWYGGITHSGNSTHPVGQKRKNAWGFYDMHGNVGEWCYNHMETWETEFMDAITDPVGPQKGDTRQLRGGSWYHPAKVCRSATLLCWIPDSPMPWLGFRLALVPVQ